MHTKKPFQSSHLHRGSNQMLCHSEILELSPNQYWKYPLSFFFFSDKKRNMNLDVGLDNCLSEAYANNFHPSGKMAVLWGKRKQYLQKIKCDLGFVKLPNWLHQKATAFCSSCQSKSSEGKNFPCLNDKIKISKQFITESAIHHGDREKLWCVQNKYSPQNFFLLTDSFNSNLFSKLLIFCSLFLWKQAEECEDINSSRHQPNGAYCSVGLKGNKKQKEGFYSNDINVLPEAFICSLNQRSILMCNECI